MKIAFVSLGCPKNQVDFEYFAGSLADFLEFTDKPEECDFMVINTCGFIKCAVEESIDTILSMKELIPKEAKLLVMGCMSERYKNEFSQELPEVNFVCGVGEAQKALEYIASIIQNETIHLKEKRYLFNVPSYAYLKIADGCDNCCSYCTIPSFRGRHKARNPEDIIREARLLAENGAKELIIISQDSTKYNYNGADLPELLEKLAQALPKTYFRLMYLNPDGVTKQLIDTVGRLKNVINYFEIPVQHASDKILSKMNRRYTFDTVSYIFRYIRSKLPSAFIRTTIMTGFPSEDEEDFEETVKFLEEYSPDFAGFFAYSPEGGTSAAKFEGRVTLSLTNKRIRKLQKLQKRNTENRLKRIKEIICFAEKENTEFPFILEGRALFQAPEIDGLVYIVGGISADGSGPYRAKVVKVRYPDIYVELLECISKDS